jgi:G3E family GTPase
MENTETTALPATHLPVTLLVGFLGSGKTTLANHILSSQNNQRIAVIVNEFGDVGIDGRLVVGVDDNVVELSNGCLCCTVRGGLAETLHDLLARRQRADTAPFERILIEASGLASPGPVMQMLFVDTVLAAQLCLDGVITMAHAQHIGRQLREHPEASAQIAYADHVIVNHCDQCDTAALTTAEAAIQLCNPQANLIRTTRAQVDVVPLLDTRTWERLDWHQRFLAAKGATDTGHTHDHDHEAHAHEADEPETLHTSGVSALTLQADTPLDLNRLKLWLLFVSKRRSHELMRLKGILHCQHHDTAVIIQGVYQWLELRQGVDKAPEVSVLVLIGRNLNADELRREWENCRAAL